MKYYSEVLGRLFDTKEELEKEELQAEKATKKLADLDGKVKWAKENLNVAHRTVAELNKEFSEQVEKQRKELKNQTDTIIRNAQETLNNALKERSDTLEKNTDVLNLKMFWRILSNLEDMED